MQIRVIVHAAIAAAVVASSGCDGGAAEPLAANPVTTKTAAAKASSSTAPTPNPGALFSAAVPWATDVSGAQRSPRSDAIIAALNDAGGWGNADYCYCGPDCDEVPAEMPVPSGAYIEGSPDLTCDAAQEDCHLLVVDRGGNKLYESYQASAVDDAMTAGGSFVWDFDIKYSDTLRGEQCTSADAAGFPIAALTPTADEVAAGEMDHGSERTALRCPVPAEGRLRRLVVLGFAEGRDRGDEDLRDAVVGRRGDRPDLRRRQDQHGQVGRARPRLPQLRCDHARSVRGRRPRSGDSTQV